MRLKLSSTRKPSPAGAATSMRQLLVPRSRAAKAGPANRRGDRLLVGGVGQRGWAFRGIIAALSSAAAGTGKGRYAGCLAFHLDTTCRLRGRPSMDTQDATAPHLSRKQMRELIDRYRVTSGKGFRLTDFDPTDTAGHLLTKPQAEAIAGAGRAPSGGAAGEALRAGRWAMLCVLQAMDAAGKDGTIKHVMSGVNPQGVQVTSFKAPGPEELAHDFLWRANRALPRARPHRHLQPQPLRGGPRGARASRPARAAAPAEGADGQAAVGPAARGDRRRSSDT